MNILCAMHLNNYSDLGTKVKEKSQRFEVGQILINTARRILWLEIKQIPILSQLFLLAN